jgi:hypothetical protein
MIAASVSDERAEMMFEATCRYGSGNCWTGTTGELSAMIRELLAEREDLINQLQRAR